MKKIRPVLHQSESLIHAELPPKNGSSFNNRPWRLAMGVEMGRKKHSPQSIIRKLPEAEVLMAKGETMLAGTDVRTNTADENFAEYGRAHAPTPFRG